MLGAVITPAASYVIAAGLIVPVLAQVMGCDLKLTHMFIFTVSCLAPLTPPVCLASFTAARLAGSNMMKTGVEASIKALPLWVVPFAWFRRGLVLGVGTPLSVIAEGIGTLCVGSFMFISGTEGYFRHDLGMFGRILMIVIGLMIMQPISEFYSRIFLVTGVAVLIVYGLLPHFSQKLR